MEVCSRQSYSWLRKPRAGRSVPPRWCSREVLTEYVANCRGGSLADRIVAEPPMSVQVLGSGATRVTRCRAYPETDRSISRPAAQVSALENLRTSIDFTGPQRPGPGEAQTVGIPRGESPIRRRSRSRRPIILEVRLA
jgi:hypothetical protein